MKVIADTIDDVYLISKIREHTAMNFAVEMRLVSKMKSFTKYKVWNGSNCLMELILQLIDLAN